MKRFSAVIACILALAMSLSGCKIIGKVASGVLDAIVGETATPEKTVKPTRTPKATRTPRPTEEATPVPLPEETPVPTAAAGLSGNREDMSSEELITFFKQVVFANDAGKKLRKWADPIVVSVTGPRSDADDSQLTSIFDLLNSYDSFPGATFLEAAGADANVGIEVKFVTEEELKAAVPEWDGSYSCYVSYQYDNYEIYHSTIYLVSDWEKDQAQRNYLFTWAVFFSLGMFNKTDMYYDSIFNPGYYDQYGKSFTYPVAADYYLVSMLYSKSVLPGMTMDEAVAALQN